jgi:hypothetical protein
MDDTTLQLGLLMEAAQTHQKAAESALRKLKSSTTELASQLREEVRTVLTEQLRALASDSNRAAAALRQVQRAANVRALVWSLGITGLCSAIPVLLACWLLPSRSEIASLRARRDELTTKIASLEERGGRIDLRHCGKGARLCVRVDRKAPTYGEQSDYLVVRGY